MVNETPDLLCVWWNNLKDCQKREIPIHLGHLPLIMDFKDWPKFIMMINRFWDDKMMAYLFGNVEITPTLEDIKDFLDSIKTQEREKYIQIITSCYRISRLV